jgi:hypothetical protein
MLLCGVDKISGIDQKKAKLGSIKPNMWRLSKITEEFLLL